MKKKQKKTDEERNTLNRLSALGYDTSKLDGIDLSLIRKIMAELDSDLAYETCDNCIRYLCSFRSSWNKACVCDRFKDWPLWFISNEARKAGCRK